MPRRARFDLESGPATTVVPFSVNDFAEGATVELWVQDGRIHSRLRKLIKSVPRSPASGERQTTSLTPPSSTAPTSSDKELVTSTTDSPPRPLSPTPDQE